MRAPTASLSAAPCCPQCCPYKTYALYSLIVSVQECAHTVSSAQEFAFYAWYRILYVVCPVETIETPAVYLEVMQGVAQLTQLYLAVGQTAERSVPRPHTACTVTRSTYTRVDCRLR